MGGADGTHDGEAEPVAAAGWLARAGIRSVDGEVGEAAGEDTAAQEALRRLQARGFGPVVMLNHADVVMGAVQRDALDSAPDGTKAGALARFAVATVRPSEQAADLAHRMHHAGRSRVVVTRPDCTLVGLFFAADVELQP